MPRLAIVGAGMAGLAAAHAVRIARPEIAVTVFEKARGVSGRAATRWADVEHGGVTHRWRYDHGAQYASPDGRGAVADLLRATVGDALVEIAGAVWPFDDDGTLRPDRARPPEGVRWTTADGVAEIGRRLAAATPGLDLRLQTRVAAVRRGADAWHVDVEDGDAAKDDAPFDAVLMTAPGPQAAALVGDAAPALAEALAAVAYRSQFALAWGFDSVLDRPGDIYALVNAAEHGDADGGHDVAWLAVESDKPDRAPDGCTLLLAQMSDAWTRAHYDDAPDALHAAARAPLEDLWGALPDPLWTGQQRWRYALPDSALDASARADAEALGLFVAGDLAAGKGRVHLALADGLETAERLVRHLTA